MILMISNIYDLYKKVKTSIDDDTAGGKPPIGRTNYGSL
jgi:hypothetical protein